jgi:mono/diheme cytochrome c family protein
MPEAVDPYLMWAVSEGGKSFGTRMPAFKDRLNEAQIWQIITYMRAGFPSDPGADDGSTGPRDAGSRGR